MSFPIHSQNAKNYASQQVFLQAQISYGEPSIIRKYYKIFYEIPRIKAVF